MKDFWFTVLLGPGCEEMTGHTEDLETKVANGSS
jgi:hypothetical protein